MIQYKQFILVLFLVHLAQSWSFLVPYFHTSRISGSSCRKNDWSSHSFHQHHIPSPQHSSLSTRSSSHHDSFSLTYHHAHTSRHSHKEQENSEGDDNNLIHGYTRSDLQQRGYNTFQSKFSYPLDSWQCEAGGGIALGWNVIVTAPTGAGKTAVGIMALYQVHDQETVDGYDTSSPSWRGRNTMSSSSDRRRSAIYTTPLKALSNQKFVELKQTFGSEHVGLSTGDMCIQRGAIITVMTTEVYRNMCWKQTQDTFTDMYSSSEINFSKDSIREDGNSIVVLDEFHYMGVVGRGTVWEESVITSPKNTQLVALSATLSNAHQISQWIERVTRRPTLLVDVSHESRPIPLRYYFATTQGILPLFRDVDAGPGAPRGLLGLRGDYGNIKKIKANSKNKGFSQDDTDKPSHRNTHKEFPVSNVEIDTKESLPKGLQLHPALARIEQQRIDKIHRIMARKVLLHRWERVGTQRKIGDKWSDSDSSRYKRKGQTAFKTQDSSSFNPQKMSREERKERDQLLRQEMRKSVPSISFLVDRLQQMNLLPAIFFIFSRVGCDNAAEAVCQSMRRKGLTRQGEGIEEDGVMKSERIENKRMSRNFKPSASEMVEEHNKEARDRRKNLNDKNRGKSESTIQDKNGRLFRKQSNYISEDIMSSIMEGEMPYTLEVSDSLVDESRLTMYSECGLLGKNEVIEVVKRVRSFNDENHEIRFDDETVDRFYFGIASHHAGQLPAHKAFVESLFRSQLIKVVFATETLAAGINMPARTTVICQLAKRGDNQNMNLLETSSLLQMAGRAGRRGMDTDGTCIISATPFEGPDSAIEILTNELKPVVSQFTPSYSLVINLIARGNGTLDVARTLVQSSFAYFEKEGSEKRIESAREVYGDDFEQVVQMASHEKFLDALKDSIKLILESGAHSGKQRMMHERVLHILSDKALLKKESKAYLSLSRIYDIEVNTLTVLEREAAEMVVNEKEFNNNDDCNPETTYLDDEINAQKIRIAESSQVLSEHIFTEMAIVSNFLMNENPESNELLRVALNVARKGDGAREYHSPVEPLELTSFVKSAVSENRKRRRHDGLSRSIGLSSPTKIIDSVGHIESFTDNAWKDTIALTRVLSTYGCLVDIRDDRIVASEQYRITTGGKLLLEIGLENSLWCIVALGGAWDVVGNSAGDSEGIGKFGERAEDKFQYTNVGVIPEPQLEADLLVSYLRELDASEMAGYVSCLVADEIRGSASTLSSFDNMSHKQKVAVQQAFCALDRLERIQRQFQVDMVTGRLQMELGACQVITAWAAGCSWADALEISGLSPGDLIRVLHRALDALRQIASLTYTPFRPLTIVQSEAFGIHPEILQLCREAAFAMDRYPVKDTLLSFDEEFDSSTNL